MIGGHDNDFPKNIGYCNVDRNLEVYNYRFNDGCNANPMDLLWICWKFPGRFQEENRGSRVASVTLGKLDEH